jgi:hypothetical protein
MRLNIVSTLNQVAIETPSEQEIAQNHKLSHPYYGLRDGKGWLTRFPKEGLILSREWIETFLQCGGKLDSNGVWGASPYYSCELNPVKAAEFFLAAHCQRWDNVECGWAKYFQVNDDCSFADFRRLCKGASVKERLNSFGIETNLSLFSLARKSEEWVNTQIANHFQFTEKFRNWGEYELEIKSTNPNWIKFQRDNEKYMYRRDLKYHTPKPLLKVVSLRMLKECALGTWGKYKSYQAQSVRTSVGYIYFTETHLVVNNLNNESYAYYPRWKQGFHSTKIRQIGRYSVAVICGTAFGWVTSHGFRSHIEGYSIKEVIEKIAERIAYSDKKEEALKGVLSFRLFRELTNSCLAGTRSFLSEHAPFLYNLLQPFYNWDDVLESDIADIIFELTPEFMESIKFRF